MISPEILQKIRHLEIKTRRMLSGTAAGDNMVAHKGFGIEFDQLRDYQQGDDVRFIDWRATARMNKTMVKEYLDDRNRSIHLMVDVSPSVFYGSGYDRKIDVSAQISSALALVADYAKDQVSLTLFDNDGVVKYIPSGRGRMHVHDIMKVLFESCEKRFEPSAFSGRPLAQHVATVMNRSALICVVSDFIHEESMKHLSYMRNRHDVVAVRVLDPLEFSFPACGRIALQDSHENSCTVNASKRSSIFVENALINRREKQDREFNKYRIDAVTIACNSDILHNVIPFFQRRMTY